PKKASSDSDSDDFGGAALTSKVAAKPAGRGGRAAAQKPKRYAQDSDSDSNGSASDDDVLEDVTAMVKGIGPNSTLVNDGPTRLFHPPSVSRPSSSSHKLAKASSKLGSKKITADSDVSEDETNWEALARNSPQKAAHHPISAGEAGLDSDDDDELLDLDIKARPKPVVTTT
ncbi:DNA topoisomerase 2, partial [Friedmanniomyces endolithicus]